VCRLQTKRIADLNNALLIVIITVDYYYHYYEVRDNRPVQLLDQAHGINMIYNSLSTETESIELVTNEQN